MNTPNTNFRALLTIQDMERIRLLQAYRKAELDIVGNYSQAEAVRFALKLACETLQLN